MGKKSVNQSKMVYEYLVSKGPKKGWVTMTAQIKKKGSGDQGQMDLSKLRFTADIHSSGEIRNIQYTGNVMPDMGEGADQMSPQMRKMMENSYKMIPEAYKNAVFWFPEVPEDNLEIGDEFDLTVTYDYSEDVTFGLLYAVFNPGDFFELASDEAPGAANASVDLDRASEVMGSVKVTF